MSLDYYASLAEQKACPNKVNDCGLASGFADGCLVWSCNDNKAKNDARRCYMKRISDLKGLKLPPGLNFDPDFSQLPDPSWFGIEVDFELLSPWYSKDDRPFHVLDNPVRKDRVFGVPYMSSASWKGLLRWACRMEAGLLDYLKKHDMKLDGWKNPAWIVHLFGNERGEGENFSRGTLMFYPTWFDKVGFEVINPHKRKTRAGTQPIYYEVVPARTKGRLRLLYAPLPGEIENDKVNPADFIDSLINSITALLETYGIAAKRTAGWGTVEVKSCTLFFVKGGWIEQNIGLNDDKKYETPDDSFMKLMDKNGLPIEILRDEEGNLLSGSKWRKLGDQKPCDKKVFEKFREWYQKHSEEYRKRVMGDEEEGQSPRTGKLPFNTLADLQTAIKKLKDAREGGGR